MNWSRWAFLPRPKPRAFVTARNISNQREFVLE
jgi:hypothetical protein